MTIAELTRKMKLESSTALAASESDARNNALRLIAKALEENKEKIFAANAEDLENAEGVKEFLGF